MTTMPRPSRPLPGGKIPVGPATQADRITLDFTARDADDSLGLLVMLYAVPGWGKTSLFSHATNPYLVMGPRENGYEVLLRYGRVPKLPRSKVETWTELLATLTAFSLDPRDRKWLGLDSISVMEQLCREHICNTCFKGNWGKGGFQSFGDGDKLVTTEWQQLISRLEAVTARGVNVMLLGHCDTQKFSNPDGADYSLYSPLMLTKDAQKSTVGSMNAVLFGQFLSVVEVAARDASKNMAEQKGKVQAVSPRIIRCEYRNSATGKNLMGLPDVIDVPDDYTKSFDAINEYLKT